MELLKKVGDHESFVFHNEQINHIEDLVAVLKDATEEEYAVYASEDKNDFANWVEHVLNNKDVADKLRASASKDDTISLLEAEVSSRKQESVLESKDSILNQAPVEKPESVSVDAPIEPAPIVEEPITAPSESITPVVEESINASIEPAPIIEEPMSAPIESMAPVESAPIVEEPIISTPEISEPVEELSVPTPETVTSALPIEESIKPEESVSAPSETSPESIIPNVVTPINQEDPKQIKSDVHPHHFCGVHMDCMRREFVFGLLIGLLIGIIGLQMIHAIL